MKVAFTGGRDYGDDAAVRDVIMDLMTEHGHGRLEIVVGDARGADALVRKWAQTMALRMQVYDAPWADYGKAAGPIRNQRMIDAKPDLLVAFPGGRGTADMVSRARAAGVPVRMVAEVPA